MARVKDVALVGAVFATAGAVIGGITLARRGEAPSPHPPGPPPPPTPPPPHKRGLSLVRLYPLSPLRQSRRRFRFPKNCRSYLGLLSQ